MWDQQESQWFYYNPHDGSRVYNTLKWDPQKQMYIIGHDDEHEDAKVQSVSSQGRDSHNLASKATTQTGDQTSPTLERTPSESHDTWLEEPKGDTSDTQTKTETEIPCTTDSSTAPDNNQNADFISRTASSDADELSHYLPSETTSSHNWKEVRSRLFTDWQWDLEYHATNANHGGQHGSWTFTPMEPTEPKACPLKIGNAPVVLPVEYRWPPVGGVTPRPDPRATAPIDCYGSLSFELVKDLFLTFQGSVGFYVLINGLLQVIVPERYDTSWALSHLPHRYGGLKVCYIEQNLESTMLPNVTDTSKAVTSGSSRDSPAPKIPRPVNSSTQSITRQSSLKLNDFIEARTSSNHRRERFSGRIGLRVAHEGNICLAMSTHVITEAILAKSPMAIMVGRVTGAILAKSTWDRIVGHHRDERCQKLHGDWNDQIEIWAGQKRVSI